VHPLRFAVIGPDSELLVHLQDEPFKRHCHRVSSLLCIFSTGGRPLLMGLAPGFCETLMFLLSQCVILAMDWSTKADQSHSPIAVQPVPPSTCHVSEG